MADERTAAVGRETSETGVAVTLDIDGSGGSILAVIGAESHATGCPEDARLEIRYALGAET